MAYAHEIMRVTFGGQIYNTDIWSNTLHIGKENANYGLALTSNGSELDEIAEEIRSWFVNPNSMISRFASLEFVKFAVLGTDGKYIDDPYIVDIPQGTVGGYAPSDFRPLPQQTVALTMTTDERRGLARIGRIYPPLTGLIDGNGRVDPLFMAQSFRDLIESIDWVLSLNLTQGIPNTVIIASNVREGRNLKVTGIKVGNVVDTQRSRRNAFKEEYTSMEVDTLRLSNPTP